VHKLNSILALVCLGLLFLTACRSETYDQELLAGKNLEGKTWNLEQLFIADELVFDHGSAKLAEGDMLFLEQMTDVDILDLNKIAKSYRFEEGVMIQEAYKVHDARMSMDLEGPAFIITEWEIGPRSFTWSFSESRSLNLRFEEGVSNGFEVTAMEVFYPSRNHQVVSLSEEELHLIFEYYPAFEHQESDLNMAAGLWAKMILSSK